MSLIPVPFSIKSSYVKAVLAKLKYQNRFHIEEHEEVIDIYDFFEELLNIVDLERKRKKQ